jgi:hypothetical protein
LRTLYEVEIAGEDASPGQQTRAGRADEDRSPAARG